MNLLYHLQLEEFEALKKLLSSYTSRAYLVGGCVRDILLKKTPKDFDIELYDMDEKKMIHLAKSIGAVGVGKSFFVYKYNQFDLSLPRVESKTNPTHQGFEVSICQDEKLASQRRDFTMNALMIDIFSGELKDFWGGVKDIKKKHIALIHETKFKEDSLRVLRGVRFAAQLGFVIEKNTAFCMKNMDLDEISKDRIFWELEKIFVSQYPSWGLLNLYNLGILKTIFSFHGDFKTLFNVAKKMDRFYKYQTKNLKPYIFLYVLVNELNLDMKSTLLNLHAPKRYMKYLLNSPYLVGVSDFELLNISLDTPLCEWVGICQKGLKKKAQKFGVWDRVFQSKIFSKDVINDGFKKEGIAKEIKRRKIVEIREFLDE